MAVETGSYISALVATNPASSDPKSEGDNHIRFVKEKLLETVPNLTGAMTASHTELNILDGATLSTAELNILDGVTASTAELNILDGATVTVTELNYVDGVTSGIQAQIDLKAPLASPALTGTPIAPTAASGTATDQIATTSFVASTSLVSVLPGQTGNAGKLINTDGTTATWSATLDNSVIVPSAGTALATTTQTQTLTNKTLQTPVLQDSSDATKKANIILSGITAGQNRNITIADEAMTLFTPGWRLLSSITAANSATVDIEHAFDSTYNMYVIVCAHVTFAAAGTFNMRMKIGGSYITSATYNTRYSDLSGTAGDDRFQLVDSVGNGSDDSMSCTIWLPAPYSTVSEKYFYLNGFSTQDYSEVNIGGKCTTTPAALTGVRLYQATGSGNILTGSFKLYGLR